MSVVRESYQGQQVRGYGDQMALTRLRNTEVRRVRAAEMFLMKRAGVAVRQIAFKYRLTPQYVYQEIASLPEDQRGRLAKFGLEGLYSALSDAG